MSDIGGSGNSSFDTTFFALELACVALWLLSAFGVRWVRLAPWRWRAALALAIFTEIVLPAVWWLGFPPSGGLEGVGRVLVGVPCMAVQWLFSSLWAVALAATENIPKLPAVRPFLITAALSLLAWVYFLVA